MILYIINKLFWLYSIAIIVYCLLSWFPGGFQSKLGRFLAKICDPYLNFFNFIPPIAGISFGPFVALIALEFIQRGLIGLLLTIGLR